MKILVVFALLIIGATAHDINSVKPSDFGAPRGGPHGAGRPPHGGGRPFRPPHGPRGDGVLLVGKPLNPNNTSGLQFIPVYRANNVTLQNANTTLPIKQGESIFLLPRPRGPPHKDGRKPPQTLVSYVKILYNSNSTTPLSFEYGVTQLRQPFLLSESESHEDILL